MTVSMELCEVCGRTYSTKSSLQRHIREFHSKHFKCFKCEFCQRLFIRKSSLHRHLRKIHKSESRMSDSRHNCSREQYNDARKPVYVTCLSDLYEMISSDEEDDATVQTDTRVVVTCASANADDNDRRHIELRDAAEEPTDPLSDFYENISLCSEDNLDNVLVG